MSTESAVFTIEDITPATVGFVTDSVLKQWVKRRQLPFEAPRVGSGRRMTYTRAEVYCLALIAEFRQQGASMATARRATVLWVDRWLAPDRVAAPYVVWTGGGAAIGLVLDARASIAQALIELGGNGALPSRFGLICPLQVIGRVNEILDASPRAAIEADPPAEKAPPPTRALELHP